MRILQIHNRYRSSSPSGENRVVDLEGAALREHGHQVERFERSSDEIEEWPAYKRALVGARLVWSQEAHRDLTKVIDRFNPDVVHVHNVVPLLSPSVLYACSSRDVPVVATLHNYRLICPSGTLFRDGNICHACVGRLPLPSIRHGCFRNSPAATVPIALSSQLHSRTWRTLVSAYICISESQREILTPFGLDPERVFVKSNLVPYIEMPASAPADRDTIVYTGRLDEVKGLPLLMGAWDRYVADSSGRVLRLVVAGAGALEDDLTDWARGRSDVEFVGLLSAAGCRELMRTARAAVAPSQWEEPFGLVIVEAMAAGVPLIASAHGSFPELVSDGVEGILFEPGSSEKLAAAFHEAESSPERFDQLGRNARAAYEARFDPEVNLQELVTIYKHAIDHPAVGPRPTGLRRSAVGQGPPATVLTGQH